jgi:glycerol-3-phosphate dehydrogenase
MTWPRGWRERVWDEVVRRSEPWDVVVVGGGIAGAAVFREAVRHGLQALLLEARDFGAGTSSHSSKLVHGGIRYLEHGHWRLTRESLRERDRLLREAPGLVEPLYFVRPVYREEPARWRYAAAFAAYGLLAGRRQHTRYSAKETLRFSPALARPGLVGSYGYMEAGVDDARLVLRLVREGVAAGGHALSGCEGAAVHREGAVVNGLRAREVESGGEGDVPARTVVNATGARVDELRRSLGASPRIRPLRGSHLVFAPERFPMEQALSFRHPEDGRHVFACSWEGATILGTTDCDHDAPLDRPPAISAAEVDYLMAAARRYFPGLALVRTDVIGTWAGVRPVVGSQRTDPSAESREALLMDEHGLVSVTGGKLTTARTTALATLAKLRARLPGRLLSPGRQPFLEAVDASSADHPALDSALRRRLLGHHGREARDVIAAAREGELEMVPGTRTLWAQLRHAARAEGVTHLDDLMLRRSRLGLVLPEGGAHVLRRVRAVVQEELGWTDQRWAEEESRYRALWRERYGLPERG